MIGNLSTKEKVGLLGTNYILHRAFSVYRPRLPQMSATSLEIKEIAVVPVVFGEQGVIKTIQLLPGIKSNEGGGGLGIFEIWSRKGCF